MNCMTFSGVGVRGDRLSMWASSTQKIANLSLAKHVHGGMGHVHWSSHCGTMMS